MIDPLQGDPLDAHPMPGRRGAAALPSGWHSIHAVPLQQ